jgi:glycosyltransferase involved in cell wall biosynthesis
MMRVLMIDSLIGNDYTLWLCRGLAEADADVTLITTENRSNVTDQPYKILPVSPPKRGGKNPLLKFGHYLYYLAWLFIYILRTRPDIVHYQFFRRSRIECLYFPLLRLITSELIYTAHNVLPHEHGKLDYYLYYLVYRTATKIIVHTASIREKLLKLYDINPAKVAVIPAVRPVSGTRNISITRETARQQLNFAPDDKILLFFGYIRPYKGVDLLLEAFEIARPAIDNLKLIIAGKPHTPELQATYETQIANMAYGDWVIFRPEFIPKEDVDAYFMAADAVAMPYTKIDFSGIMQEAFMYRKAVLATNVGNFATLIESGVNGYITQQNTAQAFAEIIHAAFSDMAHLYEMGQTAYTLEQERPDWQEIGQMTLQLYHDLHSNTLPQPHLTEKA